MNSTLKENLLAARQDVLAARKCENINDPFDTYVVDYIAMAWSRLFIRLHIIPNAVTLLSGLSGVAGGILLAVPSLPMNVLGAVLVFLSAVFDASDGQVARLTHHYSRLGRMLDGAADSSVYITLYVACLVRLYPRVPIDDLRLRSLAMTGLFLAVYLLYVAQCQLPDYFKNLHMYMIDNSHGSELTRGRHIRQEMAQAPRGSFQRFSLLCYYIYTRAQERRAPWTQKLLDAIEEKGKNEALCDAFYAKSRTLVRLTNLLTFNLRTLVLLASMFLHMELAGMLFVVVVLEPIRWWLLLAYERLSRQALELV